MIMYMRRLIIGMVLLMLMMTAFGCSESGRTLKHVYVSKDPNACKSTNVDCSQYNNNLDRASAFNDETGCGCEIMTGN